MLATRLSFVSLLCWLLLHEPVISMVNRPVLVVGIPLLYLYVMGIWVLLIGLMAATLYRHTQTDHPNTDTPDE